MIAKGKTSTYIGGVATGIGIASAAFALKEKKNREMLYKKFSKAKKESEKIMHQAQDKKSEAIKDAKDLLKQEGEVAKDFQEKAKKLQEDS